MNNDIIERILSINAMLESRDFNWTVLVIVPLLGFIFWTWPQRLDMPGPGKNIPYFGAFFEVFGNWDRLPDYLVDKSREYQGKTWGAVMPGFGLLSRGAVFLQTPEDVKHVLRDNFGNYEKGSAVRDALHEFLGSGIFTADGPMWKLHRKVASNMFSRRLMRESTMVVRTHAMQLVDFLSPKAAKQEVVNIQNVFFRLTMDIFTSIAFGVELESVIRDKPHPFAQAFDDIQNYSEKRVCNPLWFLCKRLQLTHGERVIARQAQVIDEFAKEVIAGKRRGLEVSKNEVALGPDILSRFLLDASQKNEVRSDRELRDVVLNFMIAGRDTTACALTWTLYELAKVPDIQDKLRAEFSDVFKDGFEAAGGVGDERTYDKVAELKYFHAVVQEVLRLHPSVPKDLKFAKRRDTLPDGTVIPAGTAVIYSAYCMGRDARLWDDPLKFNPERFLPDGKKVLEPSQYQYVTFNAGPRICLGKGLAMMEVKLIIGVLLNRFDFKVKGDNRGEYDSTLVLPMKAGLDVSLSLRDR